MFVSFVEASKKLVKRARRMELKSFPKFVTEVSDDAVMDAWMYVFKKAQQHCQILVNRRHRKRPLAVGLAFPAQLLAKEYPVEGISWLVTEAARCHCTGLAPNTMAIMGVSVSPQHQQRGFAGKMLVRLKQVALQLGLPRMLIAVRPLLKPRYPLILMRDFVIWKKRGTDELFDPWLRLHVRCGGAIVGLAPKSNAVCHGVRKFEKWTGLEFHTSGSYTVAGAVAPLHVNVERNVVEYTEEDVWVEYVLEKPVKE